MSMTVKLHLKSASGPNTFYSVDATYVKEGFYCLRWNHAGMKETDKYPMANIFRVIEETNE